MKNRLLLLLLLLPLLLIGISNSHDWGDDFSQYLLQARNLVEGHPQTNHELVFAEGELPYAIVAYPVGFPVLLAPLFKSFGLYIPPYLFLNSIFIILSVLLLFDYLKKTFDVRYCFLMAIFFAYNLISLVLKKEILSEFPFTFLLISILLMIKSDTRKSFVLGGLLAGLMISVRFSGIVILPAIWGWHLFTQRLIPVKKRLLDSTIFTALAATVFYLLNVVLYEIDLRNFIGFYAGQFDSNRLMLPSNFFGFFQKMAEAIFPPLQSTLWTIILIIILITGFYKKFKEGALAEWFFIFYLLLIIIYPYASSGLRFIYPVLPFLIIYLVKGIQTIYQFITSKEKSFQLLTIIFSVSIFLSFRLFFSLPTPDGPYSTDAHSALNHIRTNTPENAIVLFSRARALNLYAERKSTFLIQHKSEQENLAILKKLQCDYILYADERSGAFNQSLQDFLIINKSDYDTIYKVDRFLLLKMKTEDRQ
ncbi:MAG: hypothetical protein IPI10_07875 [Bacteroidetes bacterium]|nr:hypothetical protein [Bacteroidota bacterium]